MGRKKAEEAKKINRIKIATKEAGASPRLISIWLNVKYTTVSSWNSNTSQPEEENLNRIGELLQIDNRDLLEPQGRVNNGLAKALEEELQRLHRIENLPYEVEIFDHKKNKNIKTNNPEIIKRLKEFEKKFKRNTI